MNVDQLRSFVEVVATGSFSLAASRLNVTQSTVSARIRALEDQLGQPLFLRGREGADLTPAGLRLEAHALAILSSWEQARQEIALPQGYQTVFRLGGPASLWSSLLRPWLSSMRERAPDVALRLEGSHSDNIIERLSEGLLDLGVVFIPRRRPGLIIETLFDERLVLVCHKEVIDDWHSHYVNLDWDDELRSAHKEAYPDLPTPAITIGPAVLGLNYLIDQRAAGYLPWSLAAPWIASGHITPVENAPEIRRPVYAIAPDNQAHTELLDLALRCLRSIGSLLQDFRD